MSMIIPTYFLQFPSVKSRVYKYIPIILIFIPDIETSVTSVMDDQLLKKKFPMDALSFYTELYCKKKCGTKKKLAVLKEAMKSWILLNKSEKQFFITKYNEYRNNLKRSIALHLKNAEPYLKSYETIHKRNLLQYSTTKNQEVHDENIQEELTSSKAEVDKNVDLTEQSFDVPDENTQYNVQQNFTTEIISDIRSPEINNTFEDEDIIIPEPTAPQILTAKELFLKISQREGNDLTWEQLTRPQKKRYQEAVLSIKKNYLEQYRNYLEHLSSEKLFNHYINTVQL